MSTRHIHISGRVQGVGFRPTVYRVAMEMKLRGQVYNARDGVHIYLTADAEEEKEFLRALEFNLPPMAIIGNITTCEVEDIHFKSFTIEQDNHGHHFDLWITPDLAMCEDCRTTIHQSDNRRFHYAFTTCLNCGPRYSIMKALPYERDHTTMDFLQTCPDCSYEYHLPADMRFYSQTNSCPSCAVVMEWKDSGGNTLSGEQKMIPDLAAAALAEGKIVAVKGIGGYLLLCDATHTGAITQLRQRKGRPTKPFAVLYADLNAARNDVHISPAEEKWLTSPQAPIVLCRLREDKASGLIAPGLAHWGIMLPYTPLLDLISRSFQKPLIATSGNVSGCPIEYKDQEAIRQLGNIADYFITHNRNITLPQDDSVLRCNAEGQTVLIRRSRGFAPAVMTNMLMDAPAPVLAMGADMKNCLALHLGKNLLVSQYLGKMGTLESLEVMQATLNHLLQLTKAQVKLVLTDTHPDYHSTAFGIEYAQQTGVVHQQVQHHKAHFAAVLAEHQLLDTARPVMGIVWDGTGYGEDGQIWGGECFVSDQGKVNRLFHLTYFPHLAGDRMSRSPGLCAMALLPPNHWGLELIRNAFTDENWDYYLRLQKNAPLLTSSMGRMIDGFAAILGVCQHQSYEGEAAMLLEAMAWKYGSADPGWRYGFYLEDQYICYDRALEKWCEDVTKDKDKSRMASAFWYSLADLIVLLAHQSGISLITLSGGVFQNTYLIDALFDIKPIDLQILLHQEFSPNDESIPVGQLAYHQLTKTKTLSEYTKKENSCV